MQPVEKMLDIGGVVYGWVVGTVMDGKSRDGI